MKSLVKFISSCVTFALIGGSLHLGRVMVDKAVDAYDFDPFKKVAEKRKAKTEDD